MAKWFYLIDGKPAGPIESAALKQLASSGRLKPTDKIRREDMANWHQAQEVKGLFSAAGAATSSSSATATAAPPTIDGSTTSASNRNGAGTKATSTSDGASAEATHDHSTLASERIREQVSGVWADLRALNFWEEIVPIDRNNFSRMLKDPVILAVFGAAIGPLVIGTLRPDLQLSAFAMLFAFGWGMVFKHYIVRTDASWKILLGSVFFTGLIGMRLLLTLYAIAMPTIYYDMPDSEFLIVSLFGYVFRVGVWEELCKILPVVGYLVWKRRAADPSVCILIGVFSGLGFAAFENLQYASAAIARTFGLTWLEGASGLKKGVEGAMINVLVRSLSCVFSHALYSGIFSYFLIVAVLTKRRYVALTLTGLAVSATIHGVYDWACGLQETLPAIIIAAAFILFYAYLIKLQALTAGGTNLEPSGSTT